MRARSHAQASCVGNLSVGHDTGVERFV